VEKDYNNTLLEKGYRFTPQRRAVLELIKESQGKHWTAEEIYNVVKMKNPGIGIATVYRTLQILEDAGLITKDYLGTDVVRYELNHTHGGHAHHHMVCIGCGVILEAKEDFMDAIETIIEQNYGFQVTDHNIKFMGYCEKCSGNTK
jgi:Fur family transcriptional regulator, ferric uptake regulator